MCGLCNTESEEAFIAELPLRMKPSLNAQFLQSRFCLHFDPVSMLALCPLN